MRGFGGIFPLVPEGDVEGIKRSSELFEERLELAQALPVEALAGFYSATNDFGDASVTDALRSAATSRLARVLRSRTGEDSLDTLRASREILEELAAGLEHSLADTLAASLVIRAKADTKSQVVEASEGASHTDGAARSGATGISQGGAADAGSNLGFRRSVSCTIDVVLGLVAGLIAGQAEGSPQVARQAMSTLQGMLAHVAALRAGQEKRGKDGELIFEGFTCTSLDQFMDLLADLAKTAPEDLRREAADSLVDLTLLRGRIQHTLRAQQLLRDVDSDIRQHALDRLTSRMLANVKTLSLMPRISSAVLEPRAASALAGATSGGGDSSDGGVNEHLGQVLACSLQSISLEYFEGGADDGAKGVLKHLAISLLVMLLYGDDSDVLQFPNYGGLQLRLLGLRKMAFSAELGVVLNHCRRAMVQSGGGKDLSLDGFACELSGEAVVTLPSGYTDFERRLHACDVLEQLPARLVLGQDVSQGQLATAQPVKEDCVEMACLFVEVCIRILLRDVLRQRHPEEPAEDRSVLPVHVSPTSLDQQTLTAALSTSQSAAASIFNQALRSAFTVLKGFPPVTVSGVPAGQRKINGKYYPVPEETCAGKPVYKNVDEDMWVEFFSEKKQWKFRTAGNRGTDKCNMKSQCDANTVADTVDAVTSGWKLYDPSSKAWAVQEGVKVLRGTGASNMIIVSQAIPITAAERDLCQPDDAVLFQLVETIDARMPAIVGMLEEGHDKQSADSTDGISRMIGLFRIMKMNLQAALKHNSSTVGSQSSEAGRVASREDMEELRVSSGERTMQFLFDGNSQTEWQTQSSGPPHWIEVKLAAGLVILSVEVDFRIDNSYRPNLLKLEFMPPGHDGWQTLDSTDSISISSHGKHTLISNIGWKLLTGLKLSVLSNNDNGCDCRISALNITIAPASAETAKGCADQPLGASTRRLAFECAKKCNVGLRRLLQERALSAAETADGAAQQGASSKLDVLLAAADQYLDLSVVAYCASPSDVCVALLRDVLAEIERLDVLSHDDRDDVYAQVMHQVLYQVLISFRTPESALQLIGCSRGRDGDTVHLGQVQTLFSHLANYTTKVGEGAGARNASSYDAPVLAAMVSLLFKVQSAIFVVNKPQVLNRYVLSYVQSCVACLGAWVAKGKGLKLQRLLLLSYVPTTLMPLLMHLGKVNWTAFDHDCKQALAELALLLQKAVENDPAITLIQQSCTEVDLVQIRYKKHALKSTISSAALPPLINDEGNAVKLSLQPGHETTYYCGQRRSIPGSDGCCGPSNGPQCTSCKNFQLKYASQLQKVKCTGCSRSVPKFNIGASCSFNNISLCMPCSMSIRSSILAPFGNFNGVPEHIGAWIAVSAQTLGHLLAHKLLSINVESSQSQSISAVMSYRCLFANGLLPTCDDSDDLNNKYDCKATDGAEIGAAGPGLNSEVSHSTPLTPAVAGARSDTPAAAITAGLQQRVLLRLLQLMQEQKRLKLDPIKLQLAKNYIHKSDEQAEQVNAVFKAFLHHCALVYPADVESDVKLHVLECFEQAISMILDTVHKHGRDQAPAIISAVSARGVFLSTSTRPAILSVSAARDEQIAANSEATPLFLTSSLPFHWSPGLHRSQSDPTIMVGAAATPTTARKLARFLSESELSPEKSTRRSAKSLWRKIRTRTRLIGIYVIQRKRRMVAAAARAFMLDGNLSLDDVMQVAKDVERSKTSVKESLKICAMLCSSYQGAMLDAFRALSLGSLCSGWNLMLDFGVCEFLEVELREFLVANVTAVFKGDPAEGNRESARLRPILHSVAVSASVLQRTAGGISSIIHSGTWEALLRICNPEHVDSSVFTAQVQQDSTGTKMCLSTRVLACKKAGAPMLCWQARASLVVVLQTVVERIVADEDEIPIVEVRAMVKSLLSAVITRASTPDSQMLSFALGALSHLVQALAERPTELQDVISDGVRSMLEVVATLPVHGVLQMQAACALLGSFARLLSPSECDKVVLSLIESQDDDALTPGVEALKMLPDAPEDGLGFLYFFTASAMEIVQVPSEGTALYSSALSRVGGVSCRISAVANVISMLAAELDEEGRTSWWAPVSRWTRENIQPHDEKLDALDRDSLKPVGAGGGSGQGCTPDRRVPERRLVALEVLGGRIPTLDLRAQVDLQDGRMGIVVAQCKNDKAWVVTHTSFFESDDKMLYLKSPYTGRYLGPETLKLLLPWIVSMRDDLFAWDVPSGSEANKSIILQLRMFRAVFEHSAAYDGYGADGNSGEFSTMGAREIAETLLEEKLLSPITQLALNAGQYQSLRWAVAALEECVTELERVGGEVEDAARNVLASGSSNPKIRLRLQGGAGSGAGFGASSTGPGFGTSAGFGTGPGFGGGFGASTAASTGGSEPVKSRLASHSRIVQLQQETVRSTSPSTSAGSTFMLGAAVRTGGAFRGGFGASTAASTGGAFGRAFGSSTAASTGGALAFGSSSASTGGAFGGGFGTSMFLTGAAFGGGLGASSAAIGGAFGRGFGTSAASTDGAFGGGFGASTAASTGGAFGGAFGSSTAASTGGALAFGSSSASTGGAFGGGFGASMFLTGAAFGGGLGASSAAIGGAFGRGFGTSAASTGGAFGGGFGAFGGGFGGSSASTDGAFGGGFGVSAASTGGAFGGGFGSSTPSTGGAFGGGFVWNTEKLGDIYKGSGASTSTGAAVAASAFGVPSAVGSFLGGTPPATLRSPLAPAGTMVSTGCPIEIQLPAILDDMRKEGNEHAEQADACLRILSLAPCVEEAEWSKTLRSFQLSCELQYLRMDELGVTDLLLKVMEAGTLHAPLAIAVCKVLNVLGRHLTIKAKLLSSGWLPRVLAVMEAHPASSVQEAALNALSQIIGSAFAEKKNQTLELLLNAMQEHHADSGVQRAACMALSRIGKLQNMTLSAPDKADAQMAAKMFDLVLSAMQKYREDCFLQATGCAAIGVLAGPTPKDSDLGIARQAQLGKAFDCILEALQAPNGNRDMHQAACATLLQFDLNHAYLMRINSADAAVCNISLAMSASDASDADKKQCKRLYDNVKAAERKDVEIKAKHNSVLSQMSNVMSQAGKELKAAYALQIAIRCIPCLIATCTEASPGQSERILLLLEKVVLDASYRVAVKRSVTKLFAQHRANPAAFMDVCFKSLISPVVKAGASSNVATAPTTTLTVFVPKDPERNASWRLGACFKGVTDIGVSLSDTKTDGIFGVSGRSCKYSTSETGPFVLDAKLEETRVVGDRVWVQMAGGPGQKERFVAKGASQAIVVESKHNYEDNADYGGAICIEGAGALDITFDSLCHTEGGCDHLTFYSDAGMTRSIKQYTGDPGARIWSNLSVQGGSIFFRFRSDSSTNYWGWRFTVCVKSEAPGNAAETSQLRPENLSKFLLTQMILTCALDAKACVQYLAHPNRFKLICQIVEQETGTRRVAFLQILARLIRLAELPHAFDLYFAPIMKKHALRLDVDKFTMGREEGIGDLALSECVIAWETRVSVGIAKQGASSGDQESEWTVQTVGAATCLLMKKEPVAQGVSEEDNTEAFSTKIDSMQVPFAPTMGAYGEWKRSQAKYMSISRMQYYNKYSFEEIRVGDYLMQIARADRGEPASSLINVASSAATNGPAAADKSTDDDQASSSVSVQPPESVVLTQFYPGPGTVTQQWAKTTGPDGAPNTTNNSNGLYMAITAMPAYQNYSFEELRVQDYDAGRKKAQGVFGLGGGGGFGAPAAPANNGFGGGGSSVFGQINQASTPAASAFGAPATGAFGGPAAGAFGATTTTGFGGAFGSTGGGGFGGGSAFGQPFGGFGQPAVNVFGALATGGAFGAGGDGNQCLGWDRIVAAYGDGVISEDGSTVKCQGSTVSVRANRSFSSGTHTWRVRVSGQSDGIRLGIVIQQFSKWISSGNPIGNSDHSFGFYSGNAVGSWRTVGTTAPTFASGDVLELTLDLQEQRTLTAHNVTQNSSKVVLCKGLPLSVAFYPAASVYGNEGNLVQLLDAQELVAPPPSGQPYTIRIRGAGGARGTKCNGTYSEFGQHNGKPQYVQQGGTAKIYFNNYWKISGEGCTSGWCYGVDTPEGKGPYPPTVWRSDGYSGSENLPCPTLHYFCVGHQSTKRADATDPSGTANSKESPEADRERIVGSVATCRRALSEKEPVIQFQLIAPLVTPSPEPQSADIHVRQVPQEYHLGFSEESAPVVVESLAEAVTNPNPFLAHDWKTREVEFRSGFKTMRSRQRCPDKKAAYYEIEIVSPVHYPQFGFCDAQFSPSSNHGTGDCKHSWAVDGHRGLLWHDGKQAWNLAHKWKVGDVIGIACDLVKGELSFSLNGSFAPPYGVLFSGVARNSQASASVDGLFASFTASSGNVRYNLGAPTPFKFLPPAPTELFLSREIFQPFSAFPLVSPGKFDNAGAEIKVLRSFGSKGSGAGQFNGTRGVAVDGSGNIFVADKDNGRVQVFDADGRLVLSFGSKGSGQGQFQWPLGVAVDGKGHVVVADYSNHTVQVFDVQGGFVRSFGKKGTGDGEFNGPWGVVCGPQGEIFVADSENHCVKVFDVSGRFLRRIGQKGSATGEFNGPNGLALDAQGNLLVVEQGNKRVQVLGPEGQFVRVIGHGELGTPIFVTVDPHGLILVSDFSKHCVWVFDEEGGLVQRFGELGSASGQLNGPRGVAVDARGNILVADGDNNRVQVFQVGPQQQGTILHVAAEAGTSGMCRVLLDHCSELEACESSGGMPARQIAEQEEAERICEDVPDVQFCVSLVEADVDGKCIASVSDDGTITLAGNPSFSVCDEVTLDPAAPLPASMKVSTPSLPSGPFPGAPPAPPLVISRDAVGKIISIFPADPDKGVGRMASVQFASAKALVPLRDLARKAPPKKVPVRKPGDRLGFAISRPWDGSDMEIAVVCNGDVIERFDYCPSSCARQADEPYTRLMAFYADSSASSKIDSNAAAATKISQHLAIIAGAGQAGGFGGFAGGAPAEEAVARDLASAKDGHVTPALGGLLTWHEIFDKYAYRNAPCPEREIRAQGLALLVMDFMRAASLPLLDDMLLHEVHKCASELRAAGLTSAGLNFEQFLTYAIAHIEAFEPILKETNLKKWSKKMNMSPSSDGGEPGDVSANPPSLHVKVWASGGKGSGHCGGISVDELLQVATETQQQTLAVALGIARCGKAQWLSRCARVAMDTISSIVNASVDMPEVMTYQSPAKTTRVAGKGGSQASAPGGPQTAPAQVGASFRSSDAKLQKHLDAVDASARAATATNNADLLRAIDPNAGQWLNYLRTMCAAPQGAARGAVQKPATARSNDRASSRLAPVSEDAESESPDAPPADAPPQGSGAEEVRVPLECYVAMSTLLSFRGTLLKGQGGMAVGTSAGGLRLRKSDIDGALKIASLSEVKASLRMLQNYLDKGVLHSIPSPGSTIPDASPGTPASPGIAASDVSTTPPESPSAADLAIVSSPAAPATPESRSRAGNSVDDEAVLSHLAVTVTRLSSTMLHLLDTLPLVAFSAASVSSEHDTQAESSPSLSPEYQVSADGSRSFGGQEEEEDSMRRLLSVGVQLMLVEHKKPLIKKLLETKPISYAGTAEVVIDRFKAQETPGALNENTMLAQLMRGLNEQSRSGLGGGDRWWKVSYRGEQGNDAGGLFRDSLSALATECQRGADPGRKDTFVCPLFVQVEHFQLDRSGTKQLVAAFLVPNPSCDTKEAEDLFYFLGQIMGACARAGLDGKGAGGASEKLGLALAPLVWKQLLGREIRWSDVAELEPELDAHVRMIEAAVRPNGYVYSQSEFNASVGQEYDFTVSFGGARPYRQKELIPGGTARKLSYDNRHQYVSLYKRAHMRKYDVQIRAMRRGLLQYLPAALLPIWNGFDLELTVAGEPEVDVDKLKAEASVSMISSRKDWFWQCVEEMTPLQRSKLLRFSTGRSRLPVGKFYVKEQGGNAQDGALPSAATCSFEMHIPVYSSKAVMLRQLLTAIETEDFGTG